MSTSEKVGKNMRVIHWSFIRTAITVICLVAVGAQAREKSSDPQPGGPSVKNVSEAVDTQEVHILTGRSVIINMQSRLERVLVSNPSVISTVTTSPTQVVMMAKEPGASSVILWDVTGHSRMLEVTSDVDVGGLREAIQQAFPTESIQVTADRGRILLSGAVSSKADFDTVSRLAGSFTKEVVNSVGINETRHGRQILLKVRFAEVDRTKLDQFGINFLSTGAANTPGVISTQQFGPIAPGGGGGGSGSGSITGKIPGSLPGATTTFNVSDLLNIFLFRPDLNLGATIRDLQQKNVLQILAEPNLLAMNGETAKFIAGGEFPFPVVQGGIQNGTAVTIQFRPFGVQLQFVALIEKDDVIRLKVAPEVSSLDFANALTISGFVVPAISTRRAETEVELRSGQSFGIAGMLDHRTTAQLSKVPGIGDIPILGQLFRSKSINHSSTELLVIVTPTIVDPLARTAEMPKLPEHPIPMLDEKQFDKSVNKKPVANPDAPSHPKP
ncbi:MAG: type II and III secretion system protein family protein [Candidatus Angelobacter sp.]